MSEDLNHLAIHLTHDLIAVRNQVQTAIDNLCSGKERRLAEFRPEGAIAKAQRDIGRILQILEDES